MVFTFNKASATNIVNGDYPNFLEEVNGIVDFVWASFDGSSRDPIVYPPGTSVGNLLNQIVMTVFPASLPNGANHSAYSFAYSYTNSTAGSAGISVVNRFTGSGGQPLSIGSDGVPHLFLVPHPGLRTAATRLDPLSTDGTATVSGIVSRPGTFNFSIRMTDANNRFIDRSYTITVGP